MAVAIPRLVIFVSSAILLFINNNTNVNNKGTRINISN